MLRLLFNRKSIVVASVEALGVAFYLSAYLSRQLSSETIAATAMAISLILYLFILCCACFRWYRDAPRGSGIEDQFTKARVAAAYIMAISGISSLVLPRISAIAGLLALAFFAHVNVILICLHMRDPDPTPSNFFSGGRS